MKATGKSPSMSNFAKLKLSVHGKLVPLHPILALPSPHLGWEGGLEYDLKSAA